MSNSIPCLHLKPGKLLNPDQIDSPSADQVLFMKQDPLAQGRTYHLYDETLGYAVGVCASEARDVEVAAMPHHEFITIGEGEVTLDSDGGEQIVVKAGESAIIPKGTQLRWIQQGAVKHTFMVFADEEGPEPAAPRKVIKVDPATPLSPAGGTPPELLLSTTPQIAANTNIFVARNGELRIGLWECTAYARKETKPVYCELMHLLQGSVTLSQPNRSWSAKAGETLVVPATAECRWTSEEFVKKIFCIIGWQDPAKAKK